MSLNTQISLVIITKNEEKNIERCINSARGIYDELIILDSESTDQTKEIALKYGAKFYTQKFTGHIEQKNKAIELASNDYILSLDADESLSDPLRERLLHIKEQGLNNHAYSFNRCTNYCGKWIKHGGWYPDKKIRLWNKNTGKWGGENPHDKVILNAGIKVVHIQEDILHYSFNSISDHCKTIDSFTEIAAYSKALLKKNTGTFDIIIKPFWKFFRDYFLRAGFLDGYYGFVIARLSAMATLIKYAKLKQILSAKD